MSAWVGQYEQLKRFCLWTKVHLIFFHPTWKGLYLIKYSSDLRCMDPFRRYSRSKSKVVRNRAELWTFFFALPNFRGLPSKSYTHFITPTIRHVEWKKFCEDTPISPEVLFAHTLNFKPDFKFSRLKFFWGTPVPLECALASLPQFLAHVKI